MLLALVEEETPVASLYFVTLQSISSLYGGELAWLLNARLCPAGPPALISPGYFTAWWGPAGGITPPHESWHPCVWSQLNSSCKKHPTKSHRVGNRVVWAPVAIATMAKKALGNLGWSLVGCAIACRLPRWEMQGDPWAPSDPLVVQEHLLEGTSVWIWESHVFHMLHFSFNELIMQ